MDNECNNSELEDLNKTVTNVEETLIDAKTISRSESPVFKCFNQYKTKRVSHCDSSDYDIPSYQINQSVKSRTSGKAESETCDSILPFSPGFSPILTFSQQFQPPSVHSLGTVSKLGNSVKTDKANVNGKSLCDEKKDGKKKSSAFESLGMMDKDISWISSMATPPPQVPGSGFNTIEKATFFPEENFQNIQPRALFSPTHDDDFGCKPLSFTSESEDESYKTDVRLSDVCATLKGLEVRSFEQMPDDCEKTLNEKNVKDCETSPVIKMRKQKKLGRMKTKKKQDGMKSTELDNKCESFVKDNVVVVSDRLKSDEVNIANSQSTNFIDDDSFHSISFTCIDELCKTLANTSEQANSSTGSKIFESDCDKSLKDKSDVRLISKSDPSFQKQFYKSKVDSNISSVSPFHNLHSYAQTLESGHDVIVTGKIIDRSVAEKGVVRFDAFAKGSSTSDTVKRLHSELSVEKCKVTEKKLKTDDDDESTNWDTMSKYLSESQLNMSDSEMFKTVEKLEKTLGSQENKVLDKEGENSREDKKDDFELNGEENVTSQTISRTVLVNSKGTIKSQREAQIPASSTSESSFALKTALGSEVTVPEQDLVVSSSMAGFRSGSGKQIQISAKGLEKAKLLMVECEEKGLKETSEDLASKWIEEFQGALENSSTSVNVEVDRNKKECLSSLDVTVAGSGISISEILSQDKELLAEFSKSHESFQNLSISAVASGEPESGFAKKEARMRKGDEKRFEGTGGDEMVGFSTASGSKVKITEEALEKAKELMANCDEASEDVSQGLTNTWMQHFVSEDPVKTKEEVQMATRFSTASGKNIKISEEALNKAKVLMSKCNESVTDECENLTQDWMKCLENEDQTKTQSTGAFSTASGKNIKITKEALEKAKELMATCDGASEDVSQSLTENWIQNFVSKDPVKTKEQENQMVTRFSTASGKKVKFTEEALQKAKELMTEDFESIDQSKAHPTVAFSTAAGGKVKITEEALEKAKQLMAICDEASEDVSQSLTKTWIQNFVSKDPVKTKEEENQMVTRFSTASGKKVKFTEEALQKAKELMAEDFESIDQSKAHPTVGFSTASGGKVKITVEALEKAKQLMATCNESSEDVSQGLTNTWMQNFVSKDPVKTKEKENQMVTRFSTASGKKVKFTEEALQKAKELMAEDFESLDQSKAQSTVAFSTASGKKVKVTEEALQKAKELMANCDEASEDVSQGLTNTWMQNFVSEDPVTTKEEEIQFAAKFSTASGKKVKITEEALQKAKELMAEDFESKDRIKSQSTGTFSTASGKKIKITEEALSKAKELMTKCDETCEDVSQSLTKNWIQNFVSKDPIKTKREEQKLVATGFSTGSGDKVKVSGQALEKAKAFMSKCIAESSETCEKSEENVMEGIVTDESEIDKLMTKFSTASGNGVKVSGEALNKARALMSKCDESSTKTCEVLTKNWMEDFVISDRTKMEFDNEARTKIPRMCFSTAAGSGVTVSENALKKARESLAEAWSQDLEPEKLREPPVESHNVKLAFSEDRKEEEKESEGCSVAKVAGVKGNPEKPEVLSDLTADASLFMEGNLSEGDWEEIIPSWLHVYNTSPSMASDRVEMSPVVSHEDGKSSNLVREYIVKSPVLGFNDRFYKKGKKRKREVEEETKVEERKSSKSFSVPYKDGGKKTGVKRTSLNLSMDFSAPFKRGKFIGEVGLVAEKQKSDLDVREKRMKSRLLQENTVKEKKQVKPLRGSHLQKKVSGKQKKWMEVVGKAFPDVYSDDFLKSLGVKEDVLRIDIASAGDFKFNAEDFYGSACLSNADGIPAGDGCLLIPDEENKFGVEEVKRAFLASPGVQPNLVPDGWVENHYKWLVWKFSHYERSFPRFFGGRCLNPNNVMLQLKYRYDREIDRNERSALKKILERDDTSVKRMVLCVCGIKKVINGETVEYELNLTDGWYSVPARSDSALTQFIEKEKLRIGTKVITQGAVLVNCEQGTSPLQANSDVHLRIFTNSTRRVRWDTKLGFQKNPHNFTISLSSILPQGGQISKIDVIVVRIYPMLYMEKTSEGHSVTRNQRSEEKAELEYCRLQERKMEVIYEEMSKCGMKETHDKKKKSVEDQNDHHKQSNHADEDMLEKFQEKLNKENMTRRNVSQFLRMKIVDYRKPDYNNPAILTVWNPNEEVVGLFSEGKVMSLMNVAVSKSSRTYKSLQINTTRQTLYKETVSKVKYPARQLTPLREVSSKVCPVFQEVDLVGIVTLIKDVSYGSRSSQIIYLADLDFHFVGIVFWGSFKDYGWESVLKVRSVVACSNLQWKKSCSVQEVPFLQVNESTVFTENPKHPHLKEEVEKLKENMPEDKNDFLTKCEEKLTEKLEESKWQGHSSRNSSGNDSLLKDTLATKFRHTNGFESKPTASSTPIKPFSYSLNSGEAEPSPIQKRIQKLQSYGEPPPLVPLIVSNNVRKFRKKC